MFRTRSFAAAWLVFGVASFSLLIGVGTTAYAATTDANLENESRSLNGTAAPRFLDVTAEVGIDFEHTFGDRELTNLVEAVGSGAVFFDYDNDGDPDLYLATGTRTPRVNDPDADEIRATNRLYRNRGDGTFEDVTETAGVGAPDHFSTAVTAADYDNDGDLDLYVAGYDRSLLFRNDGNGSFTDVTAKARVANEGRFAIAAVWFDYDRDGLLDLYVANYIEFDPDYRRFYAPEGLPGPLMYAGQPDRLYRNRGDGTFEEVSKAVGIADFEGRGMAAVAVDYDEDGFLDLYVTNDAMENYLFRNVEGARFENVAPELGVAYNALGDSTASMAVDIGDFNGDGRPDLYVSDSSIGSLFRNDGVGFSDISLDTGLARASAQFVGWGSFFFDYDNDGDLDIFKVNADLSRLFGQEDQLLENLGDGRFEDVSEERGDYFQRDLLGRGACFADVDRDGDLDVLIVNLNGPAVLLRNDGGNRNHWLGVQLVGDRPRDAIGARVRVVVGKKTQTAWRRSASGYLSQNEAALHFGLGEARRVDRIEVRWPSGQETVLEGIEVDRYLLITESP